MCNDIDYDSLDKFEFHHNLCCRVPGCQGTVVRKKRCQPIYCMRHLFRIKSGRMTQVVINGEMRDPHLEHRKTYCEITGKTIWDLIDEWYSHIPKRLAIRYALTHFDVDHIVPRSQLRDPNLYNKKENLQTVWIDAHRAKTNLNGDWGRKN